MKITIIGLLIVFMASGCSYHLGRLGRRLPGGAKNIHVKMFENRTQEVGIESDFTNSFVSELARTGIADVTAEHDADAYLVGIIHTVDSPGTSSRPMADAAANGNRATLFTDYQTRVTIVLRLLDKNNKELWQGQVLGERNYKAPQLTLPSLRTANPLYNQSARRQNLKEISKTMASEAVLRMTENF